MTQVSNPLCPFLTHHIHSSPARHLSSLRPKPSNSTLHLLLLCIDQFLKNNRRPDHCHTARSTMFKWNKMKASSGEPITPRVALAGLPDADIWQDSPTSRIAIAGKSLKYSLGRLTPDRRVETPYPITIPRHRAEAPQLRSMSLSKHDDGQAPFSDFSRNRTDIMTFLDVLVKPHKASPTTLSYTTSAELHPQTTRASPRYVPAIINPLPISAATRRSSNPEHQMGEYSDFDREY